MATVHDNTQLRVTPTAADYRRAASVLWGEAGEFCVDEFQRFNRLLFDGELPPLPIVLGITAYGKCIGATRHNGTWSRELPRITIATLLFGKGDKMVSETVLHEMVHAKLILGHESPDHNAEPWCREITRMTPLVFGKSILAAPVKPRRIDGAVVRRARDGYLTRKQLARWPHSLHEADWNRGEPIRVESY